MRDNIAFWRIRLSTLLLCVLALQCLRAQTNFSLQVKTLGIGEVTLNPSGGTYPTGTIVTLTAKPVLGSVFYGWNGAATGSASSVQVTMDASKTVQATFSNSPYIDFKKPVGFASVHTGSTYPVFNAPVTGGQGAPDTFKVNGPADFDALAWHLYYRNRAYRLGTPQQGVANAPLVILFQAGVYPAGTSASPAWGNSMMTIQEQGDLTIIGTPGTILNWGFNVKRSWNVLIRNITFQDYYDDGVNIGEPETHHVWVDHCTFGHPTTRPTDSEHPDAGLDIKAGASYITVSWCVFRNSWKTSLLGSSDNNEAEDNGKLKTTYFANYFFQTNSRNPRLRFGEVHLLNNLFQRIDLYGSVAAFKGRMVVESNFYQDVRWPMYADRTEPEFKTVYGNNTDGVFTSKTGNLPATYLKQFNNAYDDSGLPAITAQINPAMLNPGGRSIKFDQLNPELAFNPAQYYSYNPLPVSSLRQVIPLFAGAGQVDFFTPVPNIPEIVIDGRFGPFSQNIIKPSVVQPYALRAVNVAGPLVVTPPPGFEISANGGADWLGHQSPLSLTAVNGSITASLQVRLNSTTVGQFEGQLTHQSIGATQVNIPLSGQAFQFVPPAGTDVVVSLDGTGDFTSVQAAIDAAPTGRILPYIIYIKNGRYFEKITVPGNKPFIHLVGESVANVVLYHNTGASDTLPGGGTVGTQNSASFTINATDFAAFNITFANTYGDGTQAVAVLVNQDRAVFYNCRFMGNQDTLYVKGSGTPRQYFKDCYIDGNVDFVFGSSAAIFDRTVLYAKARTNTATSFITAANTPSGQAFGLVFRQAVLPNNTGGTTYFLGRPWRNSTGALPLANNRTVFLNSTLSAVVKPEGWSVWDAGTNTSLIEYAEHKSRYFNGALFDVGQRVSWSKQYTDEAAAAFSNSNIFGAWDPCQVNPIICTNQERDIAVSNFRVEATLDSSIFMWNISWAKSGILYQLYRSSNRSNGYTLMKTVTATTDSLVNFKLTDTPPASGTAFYYYLVASKPGLAMHVTDTLMVSKQPAIGLTGVIQPFLQALGTPSALQHITVNGTNLAEPIVVHFPLPFQISTDGGTTWVSAPASAMLAPVNGGVNASLAIRLNGSNTGTFSGVMDFSSAGAVSQQRTLQGTTNMPGGQAVSLQFWPLTSNGYDDPSARAEGVAPSSPTFRNLTLSNGTQVSAIAPYSVQFGQAFAPSVNGDGTWTTQVGGPGGTLRRTHYQQFTLSATDGYQLVADSLYFTAAFYNTSSNTRVAVVYSLDGFTNDSSDVMTSPGTFANPIALTNQTSGPTNRYGIAFSIPNGVLIQPGQSLTIRLYFSCGSTSAGRYAMLKSLQVIGRQIKDESLPLQYIKLTGYLQKGEAHLAWQTIGEHQVKSLTLEQSIHGRTFNAVREVPARNLPEAQAYHAVVNQQAPIALYRIKVTDSDGAVRYSNTLLLEQESLKDPLLLTPNPASHWFTVLHEAAGRGDYCHIYTADGRQIYSSTLPFGQQRTVIPVSSWQSGLYIVVVHTGGYIRSIKLWKQ